MCSLGLGHGGLSEAFEGLKRGHVRFTFDQSSRVSSMAGLEETWLVINASEKILCGFRIWVRLGPGKWLGHGLPAALGEVLLSSAGSWPF